MARKKKININKIKPNYIMFPLAILLFCIFAGRIVYLCTTDYQVVFSRKFPIKFPSSSYKFLTSYSSPSSLNNFIKPSPNYLVLFSIISSNALLHLVKYLIFVFITFFFSLSVLKLSIFLIASSIFSFIVFILS